MLEKNISKIKNLVDNADVIDWKMSFNLQCDTVSEIVNEGIKSFKANTSLLNDGNYIGVIATWNYDVELDGRYFDKINNAEEVLIQPYFVSEHGTYALPLNKIKKDTIKFNGGSRTVLFQAVSRYLEVLNEKYEPNEQTTLKQHFIKQAEIVLESTIDVSGVNTLDELIIDAERFSGTNNRGFFSDCLELYSEYMIETENGFKLSDNNLVINNEIKYLKESDVQTYNAQEEAIDSITLSLDKNIEGESASFDIGSYTGKERTYGIYGNNILWDYDSKTNYGSIVASIFNTKQRKVNEFFEVETKGIPSVELGDVVNFTATQEVWNEELNEYETITHNVSRTVLEIQFLFNGSLMMSLGSEPFKGITNEYDLRSPIEEKIQRTEIKVDKVEKEISAVIEENGKMVSIVAGLDGIQERVESIEKKSETLTNKYTWVMYSDGNLDVEDAVSSMEFGYLDTNIGSQVVFTEEEVSSGSFDMYGSEAYFYAEKKDYKDGEKYVLSFTTFGLNSNVDVFLDITVFGYITKLLVDEVEQQIEQDTSVFEGIIIPPYEDVKVVIEFTSNGGEGFTLMFQPKEFSGDVRFEIGDFELKKLPKITKEFNNSAYWGYALNQDSPIPSEDYRDYTWQPIMDTNLISTIQQSVSNINYDLSAKISEIEKLNESIETRITSIEAEQGELIEANSTSLKQDDESFKATISSVKMIEDKLVEMQDYLTFENGAITLGSSVSPVQWVQTKDKVSFVSNGEELAAWTTEEMKVKRLTVDDLFVALKIQIGNHIVEKYDGNTSAGKATIVRRIN